MHIPFLTGDDKLLEFASSLCIDGSILQNQAEIPYKYYITNQTKPYEYLHGAKRIGGGSVQRYLQVVEGDFKLGGTLLMSV